MFAGKFKIQLGYWKIEIEALQSRKIKTDQIPGTCVVVKASWQRMLEQSILR